MKTWEDKQQLGMCKYELLVNGNHGWGHTDRHTDTQTRTQTHISIP